MWVLGNWLKNETLKSYLKSFDAMSSLLPLKAVSSLSNFKFMNNLLVLLSKTKCSIGDIKSLPKLILKLKTSYYCKMNLLIN